MIHISAVRNMLNSGKPLDLKVWKRDGSIMELKNTVSLRYDFYGGYRNVKVLSSGSIRKIRDICIFSVNGEEVYI